MSQISMCTLFDNIKSALMKQWEVEIVQRGSQFESRKEEISNPGQNKQAHGDRPQRPESEQGC